MMYLASVSYGRMTTVENFATDLADLREEEKCVVRSDRGLELGEVVSAPDPIPDGLTPDLFPRLLRRATFEDLVKAEELESRRLAATVFAREEAARLRLPIEVREVEMTFGGEQMIVSFVKRGLLNLAPLIRALGERFAARVEFEQIALKDAGGEGGCGS